MEVITQLPWLKISLLEKKKLALGFRPLWSAVFECLSSLHRQGKEEYLLLLRVCVLPPGPAKCEVPP